MFAIYLVETSNEAVEQVEYCLIKTDLSDCFIAHITF